MEVNIKDIHQAAAMSAAAYTCDRQVAQELGFEKIAFVGNGGPAATVAVNSSRVVVAIRGTELADLTDAIADLRVAPERSYFGGWYHRGFNDYAEEIWPEIWDLAVNHCDKDLIVTGHSLGGAMASHVALHAGRRRRELGCSLPHLVTFGAPLVGTGKFCEAVAARCSSVHRVTHKRDPVPLVPLMTLYRHVRGRRWHVDLRGRVVTRPRLRDLIGERMWGALRRFVWNSVVELSTVKGLLSALPFDDHAIDSYVEELRNAADSKKFSRLSDLSVSDSDG